MTHLTAHAEDRLRAIDRARRHVLGGESAAQAAALNAWIERSWRRCLALGLLPQARVGFDVVTHPGARRAFDASHRLVEAARPHLERLTRAIAPTRYFALLTDAQGVVIETAGPIDRADPRAEAVARVGVDLSEPAVGTSAIGAALSERHPVWLHRGEHFFADTSIYSCAGAPIFAPDGSCAGMLDLTGIEAVERPELRHLVARYARAIENSLLATVPHALTLRLWWPGRGGNEDDGVLAVDADGCVIGANPAAREMLGLWAGGEGTPRTHLEDVFATRAGVFFDAARQPDLPIEVPLWSGLRVQAATSAAGLAPAPRAAAPAPTPLKDIETALIRGAVDRARGNVAAAARELGLSRATVYRRLQPTRGGSPGRTDESP